MKDVFDEIAVITPIPPDFGCGNAGRIMRMPGSWNVKDTAKRKPVTIVLWNPDAAVPPLAFIQERGRVAIDRQNQRKEVEMREFEEQHSDGRSGVIDLINSIPIEQVVQQLLNCYVRARKKDGGLRFADDKGIERGFFKHQRYNVVVHEGTSLFPPPRGVGYNCFGLAKVILGCSAKDAVEWFCSRSTKLRTVQQRDQDEWTDRRRRDDLLLLFPSFK
jgi:hypothetical protein